MFEFHQYLDPQKNVNATKLWHGFKSKVPVRRNFQIRSEKMGEVTSFILSFVKTYR